ncbi:MAG TPA: glycoside hydrolase family 30 beta sandwich domain-containing protein [Polyangia bacterium]|nr:glycoside hydrolase family 30 beta sandwich domain-containing protein [Polyangia bacterium]
MSLFRRHLGKVSVLGLAMLAASCAGDPSEGGTGGTGPGRGGSTGTGSGGSATGGTTSTPTGGSATGGQVASGGTTGSGTGGTASGGTAGRGTGGRSGTGGGAGTGAGGPAGAPGSGGSPVINPTACSTGAAQSSDVTVNLSGVQQKITGFGVSSAWAGNYSNASDPDYLWSTTKGAGLTLLRIRYGDGLAIAQAAAKAGVTVWMTPWGTGPNGSTGGPDTTTQTANGCKSAVPVLTNPTDLASKLVSWVQNAKTQGVPIYAVSAENEPDSCGINSTTSYSAAQLASWIDVLGPAMSAIGVKVMGPETQNACGFTSYYAAIKNDSAAWNAVSIFASHEYGCGTLPSEPAIAMANKEYWETEVDTGTASSDRSGDGIASALLMASTIHNDLTKANLNAWHLWWLYNSSNNGGCLFDTTNKVWTKRLWVLGNYSRFVRPGYVRVSTTGTAPSGVLISAYKNPADGTVVVVAINSNTSDTPVSLYVSGSVPCTITPWVTSAADSLASKSPITVSNARFSATLAGQSVTTFVGTP